MKTKSASQISLDCVSIQNINEHYTDYSSAPAERSQQAGAGGDYTFYFNILMPYELSQTSELG